MTDSRIEAAARAICKEFMKNGKALGAARLCTQDAFVDLAHAALAAADAAAWRPIESAPRDGTVILLGYLNISGEFAVKSGKWALVHPRSADKEWAWAWVCEMRKCLIDHRATHWCLLPNPPKPPESP